MFDGLYIHDKWEFEEYPTIRLDSIKIGYKYLGLKEAISKAIDGIFESNGLSTNESSLPQKFKDLIEKLSDKYSQGVVILIDEYDKPLIDYLDKENLPTSLNNQAVSKPAVLCNSVYSLVRQACHQITYS